MLSKMGGRYIHYNADKLTEMLLDDILADTVFELQDIEHKMKTKVVENESQALAANLLLHISDYHNEESLVKMRFDSDNIIAKKANQSKIDVSETKFELDPSGNAPIQPKAFQLNNSGELNEISGTFSKVSGGYINPFEEHNLSLNTRMILEDAKIMEEEKKSNIGKEISLLGDPKPHQGQINRKYKLGGLNQQQLNRI